MQLVFADALDLDVVANNAVSAAFWNMGENCSCGSRLIVQESVKDRLVEKVVKLVPNTKHADRAKTQIARIAGKNPATTTGFTKP